MCCFGFRSIGISPNIVEISVEGFPVYSAVPKVFEDTILDGFGVGGFLGGTRVGGFEVVHTLKAPAN
jgi:hypothetical protein